MKLCADCKHHKPTWLGKHQCHRPFEVEDPVSGRITRVTFDCEVERGTRVPFFLPTSALLDDRKCGHLAQYWEAR